jgi:hypothetical protein
MLDMLQYAWQVKDYRIRWLLNDRSGGDQELELGTKLALLLKP